MIGTLVDGTARARTAAVRWLVGATALLLISGGLGLIPSPFDAWLPALTSDVALLLGLVAGAALLIWRVRSDGAHHVGTVTRDDSTGLATRGYADAVVSRLIDCGGREGASRLALVLIEPEALGEIWRRYGKAAVEALLRTVAETLVNECRAADLPFRHSEQMLAVYLRCADLEQAQAFGRRIRMLLASQQLDWHGDVLKPMVLMGFAVHDAGQRLARLHASASKALALTRAAN